MTRSVLIVALSLLAPVSAIQVPLVGQLSFTPQAPVDAVKKELVSSSALEGSIKASNLLKRAEHLFEIAKLGEDEYNHPTRVIGSKGKPEVYLESIFWSF